MTLVKEAGNPFLYQISINGLNPWLRYSYLGLWKRTYWNSTSNFHTDPSVVISISFFHLPAKFRSNWTIVGGVMTSYPFF